MKDSKPPGTRHPPQASKPASKTLRFAQGDKAYLEQQVVRTQKQISQASQRGDIQAVHDLQQRLMESEAARLLAVRRVTKENQGKDTAGVDGVRHSPQTLEPPALQAGETGVGSKARNNRTASPRHPDNDGPL